MKFTSQRLLVCFLLMILGHGTSNIIAQDGAPVDKTPTEKSLPSPDDITVESSEYVSTVGYPSTIRQIVIPGPELKAKPITDRSQPIIVRIAESWPHGSDFRYDIEFYGLDPGKYNIADYLIAKDGSDVGDLKKIEVTVNPILPSGQVLPNAIEAEKSFFASYYIPIMVAAGTFWLAGLFLILFAGYSKAYRPKASAKVVTVADRLKPLIDKAMSGDLEGTEKAELERVLDAFWRKKLGLRTLPADELRKRMRNHSDAGKMLTQMDQWLHAPEPDVNVDIKSLLKPYQSMNLDEL